MAEIVVITKPLTAGSVISTTDLATGTATSGYVPLSNGAGSAAWGPAGGVASVSATTVEVNLGSTPVFAGKFTITDAAITAVKKVLCWQSPGPYTGKGTLADEAAMQPVEVVAVEPLAGSAVVRWHTPPGFTQELLLPSGSSSSPPALNEQMLLPTLIPRRKGLVRGNVKFTYTIFV